MPPPSWPSWAGAPRNAAVALRNASTEAKNRALAEAARLIRAEKAAILAANAKDIEAAKAAGMSAALQDRLLLNEARVEAMAKGLDDIAPCPIRSAPRSRNGRGPTAW